MLPNTKTQSKKQAVTPVTTDGERQSHAFSMVFISAMTDYAYNTLHDHLKAQGDLNAVELLDALMQLMGIREIYKEEPMVLYVWNDEASYAIGRISHMVPRLGGHFEAPSGIVLK